MQKRAQSDGRAALRAFSQNSASDKAYECWFSADNLKILNNIAASSRTGTLQDQDLRDRLAAVFSKPCTGSYAIRSGTPNQAIYAAQAAAVELLLRRDEDHSPWCSQLSVQSLGDLASSAVDGKRGTKTYSLLNTILHCTDLNQIRLGRDSGLADYLFTLHEALVKLDELNRRSS